MLHFFLSAGNADTLLNGPSSMGVDVRASVASFHATHYSAGLMTAVLYGRHSLDELQDLAAAAFAHIPNTKIVPKVFPADVFHDQV